MGRSDWNEIEPDSDEIVEAAESLTFNDLRRVSQPPALAWLIRKLPALDAWHFKRNLRRALRRLTQG
jgi:hypothetical protein